MVAEVEKVLEETEPMVIFVYSVEIRHYFSFTLCTHNSQKLEVNNIYM